MRKKASGPVIVAGWVALSAATVAAFIWARRDLTARRLDIVRENRKAKLAEASAVEATVRDPTDKPS
ncbi:hypothetical protein BD324DRAFT_651168 [Kockovaella imperatae]|uniref:Uncharacterized protein n=1 Tax=Kockovaella imperatae TaxID=4999 RepID=A0A1Y1UF88_9TREE|nr:hypothetical protein BD324DRAFT_651168 [Kockovaella imperatae]ORX36682.1 hypothetical protein BD324DRAFT_651168 [Kockovaella imperatae]